MKRKIEQTLEQWKADARRKPIVLKGCRQCGKTYSVMDFARKHYRTVFYVNFMDEPDMKRAFSGSMSVDQITMRLTAAKPSVSLIPHESCIVLDELQECPRARMALKSFAMDGRYDVLCTGSLLGIQGYRPQNETDEDIKADIPVGYEDIVTMYPMDFEEFLWANGQNETSIGLIEESFRQEGVVEDFWHQLFRSLLLQYIVVGGMPEAVQTFVSQHDMGQVLRVQRRIVQDYRADMLKYAPQELKPLITESFDSIPIQLSRENKKFMYSTIRTGARSKNYRPTIQWMEDAGIIQRCRNLQITELPLDGNAIDDCYKVYMADTGLFVSMLEDGTQADILSGNLLGYKGAIYENLLADILGKMGRKLYYFHKDGGLEIDFILRYKGKCTLLECKAKSGHTKSTRTVLNNPEHYNIHQALKLGDYNVGRDGKLLTLPLYMAFLLKDL